MDAEFYPQEILSTHGLTADGSKEEVGEYLADGIIGIQTGNMFSD